MVIKFGSERFISNGEQLPYIHARSVIFR